jgi:hypothetical protein
MIAKLHIIVPFNFILPLGDQFQIYGYEDEGYRITFDVPSPSGKPSSIDGPDSVQINGKTGVQADVITITFQKDTFSREISSLIDPPEQLIQRTLRWFLDRLKYVAIAPQVKMIDFPSCQWRLRYLNDDGSELEQTEGLIRGRGTAKYGFTFIGCDPILWSEIFSLPKEFEAPAWHTLLIDSRGALPEVGTAIVLAATALEVFIAELLGRLVKETSIPDSLWSWINDRGNWQKEPSVDEQFDILLKILSGHSLKEDNTLWEGLKNLRSARNSFVHEGVAKLGRTPLSMPETLQLIGLADFIVAKVREWIPEKYRWPVFQHTFQYEISKVIAGPSKTAVESAMPEKTPPSP